MGESLKTKPCFPGFDIELPLHFLVEEAKRSVKNGEFVKSGKKKLNDKVRLLPFLLRSICSETYTRIK